MNFKEELKNNGFCVIPNVLTSDEVKENYELFKNWLDAGGEKLTKQHKVIDPHGIFKHHQVGHQAHAWSIRTNKNVQSYFKKLWNVPETCDTGLAVSFDGSCHIPKSWSKKDNIWTHTDQAANKPGLECYQGFVALTENRERTLVVYQGSHKLHQEYFKARNDTSSKNWCLIDHDYLEKIKPLKRVLHVPAGALVIWDSRTFHQNQYGAPNSEERIVQYVCYLPKTHKKYTSSMQKKRIKYYNEKRTTSHWPCPVHVNSLQPRTFGNQELLIDYDSLPQPDLSKYEKEIQKLL